jgi:monoterpene epsilon-lactone hydrolase
MASLQAYLASWFLKWRFKRPIDGPVDIAAVRATLARPAGGRVPPDMAITPVDGPVVGEWIAARHTPADAPVVLYLHGGGFFACSPVTHRAVTIALARSGRVRVFALAYRLAPEHRFPAATIGCAG